MSSTRSAPAARASEHLVAASTTKSLRSTGTSTAARTASRSASVPPKRRSSVSTLIALAPAGLVARGERGGVGDGGERALARARALDLGDDLDASAAAGAADRRRARARAGAASAWSCARSVRRLRGRRGPPGRRRGCRRGQSRSPCQRRSRRCRWYPWPGVLPYRPRRAWLRRVPGSCRARSGISDRPARHAEAHRGERPAGDHADDDDDGAEHEHRAGGDHDGDRHDSAPSIMIPTAVHAATLCPWLSWSCATCGGLRARAPALDREPAGCRPWCSSRSAAFCQARPV